MLPLGAAMMVLTGRAILVIVAGLVDTNAPRG